MSTARTITAESNGRFKERVSEDIFPRLGYELLERKPQIYYKSTHPKRPDYLLKEVATSLRGFAEVRTTAPAGGGNQSTPGGEIFKGLVLSRKAELDFSLTLYVGSGWNLDYVREVAAQLFTFRNHHIWLVEDWLDVPGTTERII